MNKTKCLHIETTLRNFEIHVNKMDIVNSVEPIMIET